MTRVAIDTPQAIGPDAGPTACVYIVDDDDAVRDSLSAVLQAAGMPVRAFTGGAAFVEACPAQARGCVVLDVAMPGFDGPSVQARLAQRGCAMPIVFLTAHGDIGSAVRAVQAGAFDYLPKPIEGRRLIERVRAALALDAAHGRERAAAAAARASYAKLSPREREVMALAVTGASSKVIARRLGISFRTVETHRAHLMRKLGADSALGLASIAIACGIQPLTLPPPRH